ncbi:MAG: polysaccharide deacetylase family protein [Deltaproteobacteria bacterium]|nr:polysaccharide deacetylase family protein [Deltaproteobacteria bacterium]
MIPGGLDRAGHRCARWAGALAGLLMVLGAPVGVRAEAPEPVRILLYHRVGDSRYPSTNVSLEAFRAEMAWLREAGYTVVSTRTLEDHLLGGRVLPPRPVVIQFDDGYRSVLENAWPVLQEFGYPATVFLPTRALDRGYSDFVTWDEVERWAREGMEFGVHGHAHQRLGRAEPGESAGAYARRVRDEFARAVERFRSHGLPVRWVAYPYGEYGPEVVEACRELGFRLGFTQDPGAVPEGADRLLLPRFAVVGTLGDQARFRERLGYGALALADRRPEPGPLASAEVERFGARIVEPARYDRVVNLFVSELGRVEARYDPATGRVEAPGARLRRRVNRVLISVREKATGRFALASWLLVGPGDE